jgi:tetratricopeptide (TPR) repeat protein
VEETAEQLYEQISRLRSEHRYQEAEASLARLRSLADAEPLLHTFLGDLALEARQWSDAELHYETARAAGASSISLFQNLGVALFRQGRFAEASDAFAVSARLDPNDEIHARNLARGVAEQIAAPVLLLTWITWGEISGLLDPSIDPEFFRGFTVVWLTVMAVGVFWLRRRILSLDPVTWTQCRHAWSRWKWHWLCHIALILVYAAALIVTLAMTLASVLHGPKEAGLGSLTAAMIYALAVIVTCGSTVYMVRRRKGCRSDEQA